MIETLDLIAIAGLGIAITFIMVLVIFNIFKI